MFSGERIRSCRRQKDDVRTPFAEPPPSAAGNRDHASPLSLATCSGRCHAGGADGRLATAGERRGGHGRRAGRAPAETGRQRALRPIASATGRRGTLGSAQVAPVGQRPQQRAVADDSKPPRPAGVYLQHPQTGRGEFDCWLVLQRKVQRPRAEWSVISGQPSGLTVLIRATAGSVVFPQLFAYRRLLSAMRNSRLTGQVSAFVDHPGVSNSRPPGRLV